jgi:hypothetical protein
MYAVPEFALALKIKRRHLFYKAFKFWFEELIFISPGENITARFA